MPQLMPARAQVRSVLMLEHHSRSATACDQGNAFLSCLLWCRGYAYRICDKHAGHGLLFTSLPMHVFWPHCGG